MSAYRRGVEAVRKCPECNGYGDDGDATCRACGGTRLAPAPLPLTDCPCNGDCPACTSALVATLRESLTAADCKREPKPSADVRTADTAPVVHLSSAARRGWVPACAYDEDGDPAAAATSRNVREVTCLACLRDAAECDSAILKARFAQRQTPPVDLSALRSVDLGELLRTTWKEVSGCAPHVPGGLRRPAEAFAAKVIALVQKGDATPAEPVAAFIPCPDHESDPDLAAACVAVQAAGGKVEDDDEPQAPAEPVRAVTPVERWPEGPRLGLGVVPETSDEEGGRHG